MININQKNWSNTHISILGAGKSGLAAALLGKKIGAKIFISENSTLSENNQQIVNFNHEIGGHTSKILDADIVVISPGISNNSTAIQKCISNNIPIVSEIEFASWFTSSPILAITGSNGKTTTVKLLHEMCINDGRTSLLGGNVGIPFSENIIWELNSNINNSIHVLELSSFQLEHIKNFKASIVGILNISSDHMDRYSNIENYASEKLKLADHITNNGWVIYNADDPILTKSLSNNSRSVTFSTSQKKDCHFKLNGTKVYSGDIKNPNILFNYNETKLKGKHNLQNILAASTMAYLFGISQESIYDTIVNFTPIEHRLEWIGKIQNVDYFNDSKATNIAATCSAIESFEENLILILGGQDKGGTDFKQLIPLLKNNIKHIIAYGDSGKSIKMQLKNYLPIIYKEKFEDACINAHKNAASGDTILLSPACASFDQFSSYEERGKKFIEIFNKLELII